jgi:hypothetical protein
MSDRTQFESRFRRFSRVRRGLLNAALGYRLGFLALVALVAGLLLLSGWLPWLFVNLGLFVLLALWLVSLALIWLVRRVRFRSCLEEAFHIEKLAGNLNSRVISAWDFVQDGTASPLKQAVVRRAAVDLQERHEARLDRRIRDHRRLWFAGVLVVFIALALTPWVGLARVFDNLGRTWLGLQSYLFPVEYVLKPGPGQHIYRLGTKVEVALELNRRGPDEVKLVKSSGEEMQAQTLALDEDRRARVEISSDVEAEYNLHFLFGERKTDEMSLVFTRPPVLINMQTELLYPTYTRQPVRSLESVQQRLLALPGTRITLGFTFSKELEEATITWDDGTTLPLEVQERYATVSLQHSRARQATLQVRDKHGFGLDEPLVIDFELQVDEKPQVFLPRHLKEDMPKLEAEAKLFGFGVPVQDDYGVTRVLLRWQKSTVENPSGVVDRGEIERLISPSLTRTVINFEKVFAGLDLKPGDRISFQVEAQDNCEPKRQTIVSRRCSFFIYQENLGDLTVRELGFGGNDPLARERIARSTRATTVKEPEGLKSREMVKNEFEASITSGTQSPTVRGEHAQATRDYFRLLSTVKYPEAEPKKP